MENAFAPIMEKCKHALETSDPQSSVEGILLDAAKDPVIAGPLKVKLWISKCQVLAVAEIDGVQSLKVEIRRYAYAQANHRLKSAGHRVS